MSQSEKPATTTIESAKITVSKNTVIGSLYAQVVGVSVTDMDITYEFVFVHPADATGQVISRVTMPRATGTQLAKAIVETIKSHEDNKEKSKK